jgi:hypothetical protein
MLRTLWYVRLGLVVHAADPVLHEARASSTVYTADPVVREVGASSTCCGPCGI